MFKLYEPRKIRLDCQFWAIFQDAVTPLAFTTSTVPPNSVKVPDPSAPLLLSNRLPALSVTPPKRAFEPLKVSEPVPYFERPPEPASAVAKVTLFAPKSTPAITPTGTEAKRPEKSVVTPVP